MFSNAVRLRLVWTLGEGRRTVTSLAEELKLPVSSVSRHLGKLRDKGVARAEREGTYTYYSMTSPFFLEGCMGIRRGILEVIQRNGQSFSDAGE